MKPKIWKTVSFLLLAAWAAVIFLFSAQPDTESAEVSGTASYRLVSLANRVCGWELSETQKISRAKRIEHPVRKAAHMTEYTILGILAALAFGTLAAAGKHRLLYAFLFAACYAATDEFHQLFVPGRAGQVTDVCIDAAGAAIGLLVFVLLRRMIKKHPVHK